MVQQEEWRVFPDVNVWVDLAVFWSNDKRPVQIAGLDAVDRPAVAALYPLLDHDGGLVLPTGTRLLLCTSWHVLQLTASVLTSRYKIWTEAVEPYIEWIADLACSRGLVLETQDGSTVGQPGDTEDWKVMHDARRIGATILLTSDRGLLAQGRPHERPILMAPYDFAKRIAGDS